MPSLAASSEVLLVPHLIRLARKGSFASPADATAYAVFSPRNAFATPIASLPAAVVEAALEQGWLERVDASANLRLSKAGARRVRHHLSETGRTPARGAPARAGMTAVPRIAAVADIAPARTRPQRVEGPLAWLRRRKDRDGRPLIGAAQLDAGERLAADYARARLEARVTASWSPTAPCNRAQSPGSGTGEVSDMAMAARDRVFRAVRAVGPEVASLLLEVCCHDVGLEAAEKARGWPARSGKVVLDMGLTQLARHYGMLRETPADRRPAMRAWSEAGFAANLAQWL